MGPWTAEMLEAVIFDLDDTLYDKADWILPAAEYAADQMGLDQQRVWQVASQYIQRVGSADAGVYNEILLQCGQSDSAINIRAFSAICCQYIPPPGSLQLLPGAKETLIEISSQYRIGLIADGPVACQKAKLIGLGIGPFISTVVYSDEIEGVKSRRPDQRPYRIAIQSLGCRPAQTIFVADNPIKDFIRANAMGMRTVRVLTGEYGRLDYPSPEHAADYEITSVAQLPGLIRRATVMSVNSSSVSPQPYLMQ
jgi:putative hydrolase of the HAD superfamily